VLLYCEFAECCHAACGKIYPVGSVFFMNIIIHVSVGAEKRTEYFAEERIRIGVDEICDLQIRTTQTDVEGTWIELEYSEDSYRVVNFKKELSFLLNRVPLNKFVGIKDGDAISVAGTSISFSFFSLESKSSLITTKREPHIVPFIEHAALESGSSTKRNDAKVFLREFFLELYREISITSKLIVASLLIGLLSGIFYLGFSVFKEIKINRQTTEQQNEIIKNLEGKLSQTSDTIGQIDKSNKDMLKTFSLVPNLRVDYGNGVCLIFGTYELTDRKNGKTLRYPDPNAYKPDPYEPPMEEGFPPPEAQATAGLTTEGNGTPVEYDFVGTGFHVGSGFIVTNRHVLQPWDEDAYVKTLIKQSNGRARVKRLSVYFPNFPQPFPLKVQRVATKEDIGIATIDANLVSPDIPVLPLETGDDTVAVGKTVVSMGYPNGPDRLMSMVDDSEAKSINARFGNSRLNLINYLAQSRKIQPLTTQGAITDLDSRRIVHDAKTAEGGSGAPLFGQSGKVIGVNFGVFTDSNAANMAVPIRYAIEILRLAGWKTAEEIQEDKEAAAQLVASNSNTNTAVAEKK
jgi:S1-C subfamily serine protease